MRTKGIQYAVASAIFLGIIPIFGKQAILWGFSSMSVAAIRTAIATLLLFILMMAFQRPFFYIYPVGLLGCLLAGGINGLGSLLFYGALSHIGASIGQLLYSFYPLFVALWLLLDRQKINLLTILRLAISIPAIFLLVGTSHESVDLVGVALMLGSAALYSLHILINQRVLYDVPAQTVTFYTLLSMSLVVIPAYLLFDRKLPPIQTPWWPIIAMGVVTFLSRITLFMGVKHLGSLQTALLGLGELFVTVLLAQWLLAERFSGPQWIGAGILAASLLLVSKDKLSPEMRHSTGWLSWLHPPEVRPDITFHSRN